MEDHILFLSPNILKHFLTWYLYGPGDFLKTEDFIAGKE